MEIQMAAAKQTHEVADATNGRVLVAADRTVVLLTTKQDDLDGTAILGLKAAAARAIGEALIRAADEVTANTAEEKPAVREGQEVLGGRYTVHLTGHEEYPYELRGKRGASYTLVRNVPRPYMLFAVNTNNFTSDPRLPWFTDRNGILEACR